MLRSQWCGSAPCVACATCMNSRWLIGLHKEYSLFPNRLPRHAKLSNAYLVKKLNLRTPRSDNDSDISFDPGPIRVESLPRRLSSPISPLSYQNLLRKLQTFVINIVKASERNHYPGSYAQLEVTRVVRRLKHGMTSHHVPLQFRNSHSIFQTV